MSESLPPVQLPDGARPPLAPDYRTAIAAAAVAAASCLLFVLVPLGSYWVAYSGFAEFRDQGAKVQASIVLVDHGANPPVAHFHYTPASPGSSQIRGKQPVHPSVASILTPGRPIEVVYLVSDPTDVRIATDLRAPSPVLTSLLAGFGAFLILAAGLVGLRSFAAARHIAQLNAEGKIAEGRVTASDALRMPDGSFEYPVTVWFRGTNAASLACEVTFCELNQAAYRRCPVGSPIRVRYLRTDPRTCRIDLA